MALSIYNLEAYEIHTLRYNVLVLDQVREVREKVGNTQKTLIFSDARIAT